MFEKRIIGQKPGNSSPFVLILYRNRLSVVELVGREPSMFAKVDIGVTKSCQTHRRKNAQKKRNFLAWEFALSEQDRLSFTKVEIGVTKLQTKTARKEEKNLLYVWDFFQKSKWKWVRIPWKKDFGAKKITFGGGWYNFKTAASQWPSWGIYKYALPVFWRKRHLLYPYCEKKMAK